VLLAVTGAAFISSSAILVTLSGAGFTAAAFYRCLLALPLLAVLAAAEQRRAGPRQRSARLGAFLAGLALAVDLVLWNHAIAAVGAGIATVLGNLQVLFVALLAWLLLGERPGRRYLAMLPVVLAGVALVAGVASHPHPGARPLAGIWFGLGTSLAYAAYLLILRRSSGRSRHIAGPVADATAGATLGCLLLGLAFGGLWPPPGWQSLAWLALLAVLSQTAGWLFITSSLPRLPAALSALLLLLQPVASLGLAAVVLGQVPDLLQVLGAALVCGGVLAASRPAAHRAAPPPAAVPPAAQRPPIVLP
jgi:drug/metabolite transporter (DMT)-like permease